MADQRIISNKHEALQGLVVLSQLQETALAFRIDVVNSTFYSNFFSCHGFGDVFNLDILLLEPNLWITFGFVQLKIAKFVRARIIWVFHEFILLPQFFLLFFQSCFFLCCAVCFCVSLFTRLLTFFSSCGTIVRCWNFFLQILLLWLLRIRLFPLFLFLFRL